jgi:predicted dienelactone hydrolase
MRSGSRSLHALVLLLVLAASPAAAGPPAPDALGPYAVGFTTFEVHDATRDRTLPVYVWYPVRPAEAVGDPANYVVLFLGLASPVAIADAPVDRRGPFPLVVFSHGNGGTGLQSFFLTEALASHGFVVVSPDHVGNTLADAIFGDLGEEEILASALDRPRDVSLLIDTMLERNSTGGDRFQGAVDPSRIGVAGHSFGGFTTLAVAAGFSGEAAEEFGIEVPADFVPIPADPRVRAIVPIAPASTPLADGELGRIRVPTLLVGATLDRTTPLDPEVTRPYARIGADPLSGAGPVYRADLQRAAHFSFTNACDLVALAEDAGLPPDLVDDVVEGANAEGCAPELLPVEEAQRITNLVTVAFLRRHLLGDRRYDRYLRPGWIERREPALEFFRKPLPLPPRTPSAKRAAPAPTAPASWWRR